MDVWKTVASNYWLLFLAKKMATTLFLRPQLPNDYFFPHSKKTTMEPPMEKWPLSTNKMSVLFDLLSCPPHFRI